MLYEQLKKENLMALKEKNTTKRNILGIVITKATLLLSEKRGRNEGMTDQDVLNIISKVIKEVTDEAEAFKMANRQEQYEELLKQKEVLEVFLPKMLSIEEIKDEINKLEDKSIPSVMKHFKLNFSGKVDMSLVNKIARGN